MSAHADFVLSALEYYYWGKRHYMQGGLILDV